MKVLVEPGPDAARGLGGKPQSYGWVLVDEHGEWLAYSCVWFETREQAAQNARGIVREGIEVQS